VLELVGRRFALEVRLWRLEVEHDVFAPTERRGQLVRNRKQDGRLRLDL
jgi:hypothetical protein